MIGEEKKCRFLHIHTCIRTRISLRLVLFFPSSFLCVRVFFITITLGEGEGRLFFRGKEGGKNTKLNRKTFGKKENRFSMISKSFVSRLSYNNVIKYMEINPAQCFYWVCVCVRVCVCVGKK